MEQDLFNFLVILCSGGIISNIFVSLTYKPVYRFLDYKFDWIHFNKESHPLSDNNILGKGWGKVINNLFPMGIWIIISFIIPYLLFNQPVYMLGFRVFASFLIPTFIIYLRYDIFKPIQELQEDNTVNHITPLYDAGYASLATLVIMFSFSMFGMESFFKKGEIKFLVLAFICLLFEIGVIFTDKLNKYFPIKIVTPKQHKLFSYSLMMLTILLVFIIQKL